MNTKIAALLLGTLFIVAFGSCKPKQSAYKSVYEAAKEREMDQDEEVAYEPAPRTVTKPAANMNESVRKEKITPVYQGDANGLKMYNVVIAAMGMKPNAESLKARIEQAGYKTILVQNEQGMYRVIIASSDSKEQAVAKRAEILESFFSEGSQASLQSKYGIPFTDWWILQRDY